MDGSDQGERVNGFAKPFLPNKRPQEEPAPLSQNVVSADAYYVPGVKEKSPYRVLSQQVEITNLSLQNRSFNVRTQLVLLPCEKSLHYINLHLGKQALLPNEVEGSTGTITLNDIECQYSRRDCVSVS